MAKIHCKTSVKFSVVMELDEAEIRALDGIFGYNVYAFLKAFYEKMGRAYVEPHEAGVRSLHESVRKITGPAISEINKARRVLKDAAL